MFPKPFSVTLETPSISTIAATNYYAQVARVSWGLTTASNVVMELYRDDVLIATLPSGTQYYDDSVINGITYQYKIRQYDTQLLVYSDYSLVVNYTPAYALSTGATPDYTNNKWNIIFEVPNYPDPYYVKQATGLASYCGEAYVLTNSSSPYPITNNVYPTGTYTGPGTLQLNSAYDLVFAASTHQVVFTHWLEARKTSDNSLIATGLLSQTGCYAV